MEDWECSQGLLSVISELKYTVHFDRPIRVHKRTALWLEKDGWLESVKHCKGPNTMSKVVLAYEGKHLKMLCDIYEAGRDEGFNSGYDSGRSFCSDDY